MSPTSVLTIGTSKGAPRLWIDGNKLAAAGFTPGARYALRDQPGRLHLRVLADGQEAPEGWQVRKVSGKGSKPVLDIAGRTVARAFPAGVGSRVFVTYGRGVLDVEAVNGEA